MFPSLIFPNLKKIISSTEKSGSIFMLYKLVFNMHGITLESDEQLARQLSKIEKNKKPSKLEFLSAINHIRKLLLKKGDIFSIPLAQLRTYKHSISDHRYNGNWSDFKALLHGSQIREITVLQPLAKYILELCEKEKSALIAFRNGRDLNTLFEILSKELLFDEEQIIVYKLLFKNAPIDRSEFSIWEDDNNSKITKFLSHITILSLMNTLATFEAIMCTSRPYYIESDTVYSSIIPKIHNNKLRLPCYFFVEYIKKHIESSTDITAPFNSYEKLAESIEDKSHTVTNGTETIQKMISRWKSGKTPIKPSKLKEYVSGYKYPDKNKNLILSIAPYIINYLTQSIIDLQKNNSDEWIAEQFKRYPLYRHKVFDQVNEYR